MGCYDDGSGAGGGAALTGGATCVTLPVTGPGEVLMNSISIGLAGLTAIFLGVLLYQLAGRGTRLPILRRWFPQTAAPAPISPTGGAHRRIPGQHRES